MLQGILNLIDFLAKRNTAFTRGETPARSGVEHLQDQRTNSTECHMKTAEADPIIVDRAQKPDYCINGLFIRPIPWPSKNSHH